MVIYNINDKELFDEDSIIFDCGACVGEFTLPLYERFKSNFYLYEPDPRNHRRLCNRFKNYPKIRIQNKAIDRKIGEKMFYLGNFITASSLYSTHRGLGDLQVRVETTSLNNELMEFDRIDLLKLDLEGSEIDVIPDMRDYILDKINQINVEYHLQSEIDGYTQSKVDECREHLKKNGFKEIRYFQSKPNAGYDGCYLNEKLI